MGENRRIRCCKAQSCSVESRSRIAVNNTIERFYDAFGRDAGYALNGVRQSTLGYDPATGRLTTMLAAGNEMSFTWTYAAGSDLKSTLTYPNGLTASWTYDTNNQLLQVRNATPTNVISQFDYTYDAAGRRTAIAKSGTAFGDLSGSVDTYTYNARSELTSARRTNNGQSIPGFSEDFDYDPIGNRCSSATYNEKGEAQTSTYQANNLNQYTSRTTPGYAAVRGEADPNAFVTVNENPAFRFGSYFFGSDIFDNSRLGRTTDLRTYAALTGNDGNDLVSSHRDQVYVPQSPESFAYDDDGNQTLVTTATGRWRVTYNGENRPIRWVRDSDNTTLVMAYDHMGRRREKNAQRFVYDGYLQIAEFTTAIPNSSFLLHNSYIWDPTEPVATRPLAWQRGNSAAYYVFDGNKNVSEVIAADASLAAHYEYAPFGAVILRRGESVATNPWRFSSEYAEDDTATVYYNYRHYEPVMGRWLSRDPVEEEGGMNLYSFCVNDVLGLNDIMGMTDWMTVLNGAVQTVSGIMLAITAGGSIWGTGGISTPLAWGMFVWSAASVANGIRTINAGLKDSGSPEALQVKAAEFVYEKISGSEMGPKGKCITRVCYYSIDIACSCYSIRFTWKNYFMSRTTFIPNYGSRIIKVTQSGVRYTEATFEMHFVGTKMGLGSQFLSVFADFYGIGSDIGLGDSGFSDVITSDEYERQRSNR